LSDNGQPGFFLAGGGIYAAEKRGEMPLIMNRRIVPNNTSQKCATTLPI
jgi:hypothetical protein